MVFFFFSRKHQSYNISEEWSLIFLKSTFDLKIKDERLKAKIPFEWGLTGCLFIAETDLETIWDQ